ncbi:hypothetical protein SESBI_38657 [Sesbania bispinosa]|nr:hypothetical protein SESBI_38657 [Sesbania bispinosa]
MKKYDKQKEIEVVLDICALNGKGRINNFRSPQVNDECGHYSRDEPLPLPITRQQACQLVEKWLKDGIGRNII